MNKKNLFIVSIVIILALIAGAVSLNKLKGLKPAVPAVPAMPTIMKAVMSRSIDAKGNATGEATVFDVKKDRVVYAVMTLKNVTKKTKLSYIRYLNGKYVDSKVAQPSMDGITNFYFTFEKGIGNYPKGDYKLTLYVNGQRSLELPYTFK